MASHFGYVKPIEFYRNRFRTGRDGLSIKNMCEIFDSLYLKSTVYKIEDLRMMKKIKRFPCVVCMDGHYVVLEKMKGEMCYLIDPAQGKCKKLVEEVNKLFVGYVVFVQPEVEFKKNVEKNSEYRYIKNYIYKSRYPMIVSLIVCVVVTLLAIVIPSELQSIIDKILYDNVESIECNIILYLLGLLVIFYLANIGKNRSLVKLQSQIIKQCSYDTTIHLLKVKYEFYDSKPPGDLIFRMNLLKNTEQILSSTIIAFVSSGIMILFVLIYFVFKYKIFGGYILCISIGIFLIVFYENHRLSNINEQYLRESKRFENFQTEQIINMYSIKALGLEKYFYEKSKDIFKNYQKKYKLNQNEILKFNVNINLIEIFLPLFIMITGMMFGMITELTVGSAMLIYVLSGYLMRYETLLMNSILQFTRIKTALFFINDILDEPEISDKAEVNMHFFETLNIENVYFKYNDSQQWILKDINISLYKGEHIAIVGASGHGKSTILKLLCKMYTPQKGDIKINGIKIENIEVTSYHAIVGIVTQQCSMFNGSIKENIVLGNSNVPEREIYDVLEMVNLSEEIKNMPMGLNTIISEQNNNLSGGQMQRIAIARALIKKPQILLLDEATSALDAYNETLILKRIKRLGISLIVVSHRESVTNEANKVYFVVRGKLVERREYEEMMNNNKNILMKD